MSCARPASETRKQPTTKAARVAYLESVAHKLGHRRTSWRGISLRNPALPCGRAGVDDSHAQLLDRGCGGTACRRSSSTTASQRGKSVRGELRCGFTQVSRPVTCESGRQPIQLRCHVEEQQSRQTRRQSRPNCSAYRDGSWGLLDRHIQVFIVLAAAWRLRRRGRAAFSTAASTAASFRLHRGRAAVGGRCRSTVTQSLEEACQRRARNVRGGQQR